MKRILLGTTALLLSTQLAFAGNPVVIQDQNNLQQTLSVNADGSLSTSVANGQNVPQGSTTDTAYNGSGNTTIIGALKGIYAAAASALNAQSSQGVDIGATEAIATTTPTGPTAYSANVTNSATAAKASAGALYGWYIGNTNTSQCYLQLFMKTTGNVTLGSTAPDFSFMIPASSNGVGAANMLSNMGIPFANGITIAATTTRAGAAACANGLDVNLFIK